MITVILQENALVKTSDGFILDYGMHAVKTECATLREASRVVLAYIEENLLGSSTFTGGKLFVDGCYIGRVSYNGRVWTAFGTEYDAEELDKEYA